MAKKNNTKAQAQAQQTAQVTAQAQEQKTAQAAAPAQQEQAQQESVSYTYKVGSITRTVALPLESFTDGSGKTILQTIAALNPDAEARTCFIKKEAKCFRDETLNWGAYKAACIAAVDAAADAETAKAANNAAAKANAQEAGREAVAHLLRIVSAGQQVVDRDAFLDALSGRLSAKEKADRARKAYAETATVSEGSALRIVGRALRTFAAAGLFLTSEQVKKRGDLYKTAAACNKAVSAAVDAATEYAFLSGVTAGMEDTESAGYAQAAADASALRDAAAKACKVVEDRLQKVRAALTAYTATDAAAILGQFAGKAGVNVNLSKDGRLYIDDKAAQVAAISKAGEARAATYSDEERKACRAKYDAITQADLQARISAHQVPCEPAADETALSGGIGVLGRAGDAGAADANGDRVGDVAANKEGAAGVEADRTNK